jgi:hypothetical protein
MRVHTVVMSICVSGIVACQRPPAQREAGHAAIDSTAPVASHAPATAAARSEIKPIVDLLVAMPAWAQVGVDEAPAERAQIERVCERIAAYGTADIREAIVAFSGVVVQNTPGEPVDSWSKVFVVNKYLFDLPPTVPTQSSSASSFGGTWVGCAAFDKPDANILCPWSVDATRHLRLTGKFFAYTGPPFNGLAMFDYYNRTFGRREFPKGRDIDGQGTPATQP